MKKKLFIPLLLMLSWTSMKAQNNLIFFGGNGDGWHTSTFAQSSNDAIYFGGNGDGWHLNNYAQVSNDGLYFGGNGDGWHLNNYAQTSNDAMYFGGGGDGWHLNNYVQSSNDAVYFGGNGDGWVLNNYVQASNLGMYHGGNGDGWATNYTPVGPLPVSFISFNAEKEHDNKTALLKWEVSSEINASHYEVERSRDAVNFTAIGEVLANGDYAGKLDYSFPDEKPFAGFNYYRLKQVDKDAKFVYTPVRVLDFGDLAESLTLYPNPAQSTVNISWSESLLQQSLSINVIDISGKVVFQQKILQVNELSTNLDLSALASGNYMVHLKSNTSSFVSKLTISK
ncbi:MAG: T9SS type A sorting domain-containing protein [Chitinophagaceae bacterium]|nr:T9SS type A sorting domain-containing protein [Chitinophagaceae bacterium]